VVIAEVGDSVSYEFTVIMMDSGTTLYNSIAASGPLRRCRIHMSSRQSVIIENYHGNKNEAGQLGTIDMQTDAELSHDCRTTLLELL
jgi:hypothetical protein